MDWSDSPKDEILFLYVCAITFQTQCNLSAFGVSVMIKTKHKQVLGAGRGDKEGRQEYIWGWYCEGDRGVAINTQYSLVQTPQFAASQQLPSHAI
jgi:hypothetical protein